MPVDVNLDSPLIPLAGLYMAGQSSKGRKYTGGESGKGMLAAGFAASSGEWAANQALNAAGMSGTISNSLAQALIGAGISRYGGAVPANRAMARGVMYNVAGNAFTELGADAGSLFGDMFGGGGGGSQTAQTASAATSRTASPATASSSSSQNMRQPRNGNVTRF